MQCTYNFPIFLEAVRLWFVGYRRGDVDSSTGDFENSSDCFAASIVELSEASACVLSGGSREKVRRPTISLVVLLRLYSTLRIADVQEYV